MKFEQFKTNVEQWQAERGIYDHSTALAQALKAVSEVGELADSVIKGDRDAIKDAIGDVMVCLVGVQKMMGITIAEPVADHLLAPVTSPHCIAANIAYFVSGVAADIANGGNNTMVESGVFESVVRMKGLCYVVGFTFIECCESAWLEIKDRKGHMVAGGAFVKDGDA